MERIFYSSKSLVANFPLQLLLIRFLCGSFKSFYEEAVPVVSIIPFGHGPWSCENTRCPKYKMEIIKRCNRIDNGFRSISGEFTCEYCYCTYIKVWNRENGEKKSSFYKKKISEDKKDKIIQMFNIGKDLHDIAAEMFCSTSTIKDCIKKYSNRNIDEVIVNKSDNSSLAMNEIQQSLLQVSSAREARYENKKWKYRFQVQSTVNKFPGLKRYEICLKCKTAYEWLKKNDNEWMESILQRSMSVNRFSWEQVDEELSEKIKRVAFQLIQSNPANRVVKYTIINALTKEERGRIKSYSHCLPKTEKALMDEPETIEDYQLRHLPALVNQLRTHYDYKEVRVETIMSYRRSYRKCSEEMKERISERLQEL